MKQKPTSIVLAGAAPDTGNHGVTALCHSTVLGLRDRGIRDITIFDHGAGLSPAGTEEPLADVNIKSVAFRAGKRVYQSANMHHARLKQMIGLSSPALKAMKNADAVLDVSGGDSFTDMYGPARFDQITLPKLMALDAGVPLILLPQTFGPFNCDRSREIAKRILKGCTLAFARDVRSLDYLKDFMGKDFDPEKHKLGVDLAFGLPTQSTEYAISPDFAGVNVSGLLLNNQKAAEEQFGLRADYQEVLIEVCTHILETTELNVGLIPHVSPKDDSESDLIASKTLKGLMPKHLRHRVFIEKSAKTPSALKGIICQAKWFAGARMHATIAALSSGVPVANMAYSGKALGVFDCCGVASHVYDLRGLDTKSLTKALTDDFDNRASAPTLIKSQLPFVDRRWSHQMEMITDAVTKLAVQKVREYA